jgi:hypothetical protein
LHALNTVNRGFLFFQVLFFLLLIHTGTEKLYTEVPQVRDFFFDMT